MTRPNDIPEDVWEKAETAFDLMLCNDIQASGSAEQFRADSIEPHARAILAERERCAAVADAYADENIAMAGDTILMDPILSRRPSDGPVTVQELERSEDLMVGGTIHSSMFHAAQNIASAIRSGT